MATSTSMPPPLPFKPQIPATPPPDQQAFARGPLSPQHEMPSKPTTSHPLGGGGGGGAYIKPSVAGVSPHMHNVGPQLPGSRQRPPMTTGLPAGPDMSKLTDLAGDPRYLAMASRIASYYQQRCQAVANFQQQRCQAWANMHRQKCQEMMQAAMLIVAWYIRDRISRRRKRQKRQFKKRLSEKCARPSNKITKGEAVRRWVMDVPLGASSPSTAHDTFVDQEEARFSMDKEEESNPDKDTQLFSIADNLIKSQLARIDVPLLGALNFDESESESSEVDDDEMVDYEEDEEEEEEYEDDVDYEQPNIRDPDNLNQDQGGGGRDRKNDTTSPEEEPGMGSEEVQLGTAAGQSGGSRKPTVSSVISQTEGYRI